MRTPSAPFEPLHIRGDTVTIDCSFNALVLPTDNVELLPSYNEFTLTEGRTLPSAGTYSFINDYEPELGIRNLRKKFICCYNSTSNEVDFYLFTERPRSLDFTVDDLGVITQLVLYPGNGLIYWGMIHYSDLTADSNSDLIPDFLDPNIIGSLTKFLLSHSTVSPFYGYFDFRYFRNDYFGVNYFNLEGEI